MVDEVKRKLNKVIAVRLSGDKWEELRKEADWLGIEGQPPWLACG